MHYTPAADPLTPFRQTVREARQKMDAPHADYPSWRRAQANYNEAVDTLRTAEYQLNPEACDRHHLAA